MRFLPYAQAGLGPNVIVDGAATAGTILTLSHWPRSGTPAALKADTSTAIVFRYLDSPAFHVDAEAVSNNHFDEDGLVGIFVLVHPSMAERCRDLLLDIASAGDFEVFERRDAARIAFTLGALADAATSSLPPEIFRLPYADQTAALYHALLDRLPHLLTHLGEYRSLWEPEDRRLSSSEGLLETGAITIEDRLDLDLAIVRVRGGAADAPGGRPERGREPAWHPSTIYNRTKCSRVLVLEDGRAELRYRYESWVQLASRRPAPRVDLSPLASRLTAAERRGARWVSDGVDDITPSLRMEGSAPSSIALDDIVIRVVEHLRTAPPAWDPYDRPPA